MIYKNKEGEIINVKCPKKKGKFVIPEFLGDYQCKVIEANEFTDWDELTEVIIPAGVISIGENAFACCRSLTSVNIPSSVTRIGRCAFSECSGLTSIKIPKGVTNIGAYAFFGCNNLNIVIDNSEENYEGYYSSFAFDSCKSIKWLKKLIFLL